MDADITLWIIEFVLREQLDDGLVRRLLSVLLPSVPEPNSRLTKTLILSQIQSEISKGAVSEKLLDHLELVRELDRAEGVAAASQSLKDAYCAVAMACTVQILQGRVDSRGGEYLHAVVRIWKQRIGQMADISGEDGLVSEQLRRWKDEIEASLWDSSAFQNALDWVSRNDALRLVTDYVTEEWGKLRLPFLHLAADHELKRNRVIKDGDEADDLGGANVVDANEGDARNVTVEAPQAQASEDNAGRKKDLHKLSLMDRNSTAFTFEWDESIEELPTHAPRIHFRNTKRRLKKRWSVAEEDTLRTAIEKYGHGNWKIILNAYRDAFEERTEVDLKDKWRNMTRRR